MLLCSQLASSQNVFSVSVNGGLGKGEKNYGSAINANLGLEFNTISLNTSYVYAELNNINSDLSFDLNKYSVTIGYTISSYQKKFKLNGNVGPSLLNYRTSNGTNVNVGLDFGLTLSCSLINSLNLEMNVVNTLNNTTSNFVQTYIGFRYDIYDNKN